MTTQQLTPWQVKQREEEAERREAAAELRRRRDAFEAEAGRKRAADREAAERSRREAEVAERRAAIERDLRLDGVPKTEIDGAADRVMAAWHERRALEAAESGDRQARELRAYFLSRPAPTFE